MQLDRIIALLDFARAEGRDALLETEGLELLAALGIELPRYAFLANAEQLSAADLGQLPGDEVVIKVVSPQIAHKTDVGGVAFVPKKLDPVRSTIRSMETTFASRGFRGCLVVERVSYEPTLGSELLVGLRWTEDFGPIVACSAGGIHAEALADYLKPGRDLALASPAGLNAELAGNLLSRIAAVRLATGHLRGQPARLDLARLTDLYCRFAELARALMPERLSELEVNPLVTSGGRLLPLDVLVRCQPGRGAASPASGRPVEKLAQLLVPRSIAIVGVSERMNPGHVILNNTIAAGFPRERIYVVKPGSGSIEACSCFPDLGSLPERVDLLVLAVSADQAVDLLTRAIEAEKAENVIVIPGGLDEKAGAEHLAGRMRSAVTASRARPWRGPLVVGGNSMGIRSHPGRYDTTFIPPYKLPLAEARPSPLAFISQSGAFFAAKAGKLGLTPRYAISAGNQMDLTIGDYLTHLKDDREVDVFAVYCEGFRPLDGLRSIEAARGIKARGGTVVLYRAGRTPAGADASASHTAAIAGDYAVTRELARQAGIVLCDTTEEFEDLTRLFALLGGRLLRGLRLGALSNAGFECVSIADNASDLRLAGFSEATRSRLRAILDRSRIGQIVDVRNPLDLTPMADDAAFEEAVRAVLEDENVDVGFVGCVPATPALQTLPPGPDHGEDLGRAESVATRLIRLFGELRKPWAVAVDGGPLYDPLVRRLEQGGVPTFRSADRALRMLSRYCRERLGEATA